MAAAAASTLRSSLCQRTLLRRVDPEDGINGGLGAGGPIGRSTGRDLGVWKFDASEEKRAEIISAS